MIKSKMNVYAGSLLCLVSVLFGCKSASTKSIAKLHWNSMGKDRSGRRRCNIYPYIFIYVGKQIPPSV